MKTALILSLSILAFSNQVQALTVTKSQASDFKLAMNAFDRASKASTSFEACIHYRTSLIHFSSLEKVMSDSISKVLYLEKITCKKAGL